MNKKPCCLGLRRGIYQFKGSLINNQDSMESKAVFFFVAHLFTHLRSIDREEVHLQQGPKDPPNTQEMIWMFPKIGVPQNGGTHLYKLYVRLM